MFHHHDCDEKLVGTVSIGERGQIVIPANIREELNLKAGDKLLIFARRKSFIGLVKTDKISHILKRILSKIEEE